MFNLHATQFLEVSFDCPRIGCVVSRVGTPDLARQVRSLGRFAPPRWACFSEFGSYGSGALARSVRWGAGGLAPTAFRSYGPGALARQVRGKAGVKRRARVRGALACPVRVCAARGVGGRDARTSLRPHPASRQERKQRSVSHLPAGGGQLLNMQATQCPPCRMPHSLMIRTHPFRKNSLFPELNPAIGCFNPFRRTSSSPKRNRVIRLRDR